MELEVVEIALCDRRALDHVSVEELYVIRVSNGKLLTGCAVDEHVHKTDTDKDDDPDEDGADDFSYLRIVVVVAVRSLRGVFRTHEGGVLWVKQGRRKGTNVNIVSGFHSRADS
jgi:hypothetical protein